MNKKHLATAFAVFAATTMSFSAFAATIDANARAYERASALATNHCQQCLIQQVIWLNKCLYLKN